MVSREEIFKYFKECGITYSANAVGFKDFYTILNIIFDEKTFKKCIKGDEGRVRNPYPNIYPIKINNELKENLKKRIEGKIDITDINNESRLGFCKGVLAVSNILMKLGYKFSKEELIRIKKCQNIKNLYHTLNVKKEAEMVMKKYEKETEETEQEKAKNGGVLLKDETIEEDDDEKYDIFPIEKYQKDYTEEGCELYRKEFKRCMQVLNNDEYTKKYIQLIIRSTVIHNNAKHNVMDEILSLMNQGNVCLNETADENRIKINSIMQLIDSKVEFPDKYVLTHKLAKEEHYDEEKERQDKAFIEVIKRHSSKPTIKRDFDIHNFIRRNRTRYVPYDKKEQYDGYAEKIQEIFNKAKKECGENGDLPYYLYKNLNEAIKYNSIAIIWSQQNPRIKRIINNAKTEDINQKEHSVTCHTWSQAMANLLRMAEYEAYIVGKEGHQYVLFFDEDLNVCMADGTSEPELSKINGIRGTDIARTKMGLNPANFYKIIGENGWASQDEMVYRNGEYKRESVINYEKEKRKETIDFNTEDFKDENGNYDYKAIFKYIDENPSLMDKFAQFIKKISANRNIVDVINEITLRITKGNEDDDILLHACLSNLEYVVMKNKENSDKQETDEKDVKIDYALELYKIENGKTKFVPIMSSLGENGYKYYIWEDGTGFVKVEKQEIIDRVNSGVYHAMLNGDYKNEKEEERYVLPELRIPEKDYQEEVKAVFKKEGENLDDSDDQQDL